MSRLTCLFVRICPSMAMFVIRIILSCRFAIYLSVPVEVITLLNLGVAWVWTELLISSVDFLTLASVPGFVRAGVLFLFVTLLSIVVS